MVWIHMNSYASNSLIQIHGRQANGSVTILNHCLHFLMTLRIGALTAYREFSSLYIKKFLAACLIQPPHTLILVTVTDSKYIHRQIRLTMECIE
jgi:hypothetical protein